MYTGESIKVLPESGDSKNGYLNIDPALEGSLLLMTQEVDIDMSSNKVEQICWGQSRASVLDQFRVAVLVDGVWYASNAVFGGSAVRSTRALNFASAGWLSLNFVPGGTLSPGAPATMNGTHLQGVGFFSEKINDKMSLDDIEIRIPNQ